MSPQGRAFMLGALAGALVCYLAIGHAVHRPVDTAEMHGAGICLVVFAAGTLLALAAAPPRRPLSAPPAVAAPIVTWMPPPPRPYARASPIWVQRFLN